MKKITLLFLSAFTFLQANAQKLPNKQEASVRIPVNVKIDGKATEWSNSFQAYNNATSVYYTMANNNDFVYLIGQINEPDVVERINKYGFTFEIYKKENPVNDELIGITSPPPIYPKYFTTTLYTATRAPDISLAKNRMKSYNEALQKHHKLLVIKGIPGFDTVSVYNDEPGIRLAEAVDINLNYTFELQIPMRYVKLLKGEDKQILYHFTVNTSPPSFMRSPKEPYTPEQLAYIEEAEARIAKKNAATDFKAIYTLAK